MADLKVYQNDYGFNIPFLIKDHDGNAVNITGYTATLHVWPSGNTSGTIVSGTCTIGSATIGSAYYTVQSTDFTTARNYTGEIELTKAGEKMTTDPFSVTVGESP